MRAALLLFLAALGCSGSQAMSKSISVKARGLYTGQNILDLPEGALTQADNVRIRRDNLIEPRRGSGLYATQAAARIASYRDRLVIHDGTTTFKADNGAGVFSTLSTAYTPIAASSPIEFAQAVQNLYATTSSGVVKFESPTAAPVLAGTPKAIDVDRNFSQAFVPSGSLVRTGGTLVTGTSVVAHGFRAGQTISADSGAPDGNFPIGIKVVTSVPTSTTFTYTEAGVNATSGSDYFFAAVTLLGASGFLADGFQVAYRYTVDRPDANNASMEGSPSHRQIVSNTTGTTGWTSTSKNVFLGLILPAGATTSTRVRLYRSKQVASTVEPSDEMGLVFETLVRQGDIDGGRVFITDVVSDALIGPALYTSPSQEGAAAANDPPPLSRRIAAFKDSLYYARTTGLRTIEVTLLGVGSPNGLQVGDLVIIGDNATFGYEAVVDVPDPDSAQFTVETGGTAPVNVRKTALNLCAVINRYSTSVTARYLSGQDDAPGRFLLEARAFGSSSPSWRVSPGTAAGPGVRTAWAPTPNPRFTEYTLSRTTNVVTATVLSSTHNFLVGEQVTITSPPSGFGAGPHTILSVTTTAFTYAETAANSSPGGSFFIDLTNQILSTIEVNPHRVYRSKPGQPEAVAALDFDDLGSKDAEVLQLAALRDSVWAFKEDGLYRGNGDVGGWQLFDPTVILIAPESVQAVNNQLYALTSQGVVAISDTGVETVSRPIDSALLALKTVDLTQFANVTFGVGYESEKEYELRTISAASETSATQAFVYNAVTDAWTRDSVTSKCGIVHSDDKRYLGTASQVLQERKTGTFEDQKDADFDVTITSTSATTVTLVSAAGVSAGDVLQQVATTGNLRIASVAGSVLTIGAEDLQYLPSYGAGTSGLRKAIASAVTWAPLAGGDPSQLKRFGGLVVQLGNAHIAAPVASTATELVGTVETQLIDGVTRIGQRINSNGQWDRTARPFALRLSVPQQHRRASLLTVGFSVTETWAFWTITGLSVVYEGAGQLVSR